MTPTDSNIPDSKSDLASADDHAPDDEERSWDPAAVRGEGAGRPIPDGGSRTERVTIRFSKDELAEIERVVDRTEHDNRSEVIRAGVDRLVERHVDTTPILADGGGGSRYVNPTGEGYVGTLTFGAKGAEIRTETIEGLDWPPGTEVVVHDQGDRLHFGTDPDAPGTQIGTRTVQKRSRHAPKITVTSGDGRRILHAGETRVRVYLARDDPGLVLVPQARDPFVDGTDASTGGAADGD